MRLSDPQRRLLAALGRGWTLKVHRDLEGGKVFKLYSITGEAQRVPRRVVEALLRRGLIGSNQKFPAATFWLTEAGRAANAVGAAG